jgi:hypothetical protein
MSTFDLPLALTDEQRTSFTEQGYITIPECLTPGDVANIQKWTSEVKAWPDRKGEHMHYDEVDTGGKVKRYRTESECLRWYGCNDMI